MKPAPFRYVRALDVDHAVDSLSAAEGSAILLAGGQSLGPLLNQRLVRPGLVVDISSLRDLAYIRRSASGGVRIGATTRHSVVEHRSDLAGFDVLAQAVAGIGNTAVRAQGTVGGSLAFGLPIAEWCVAAVLLDASAVIVGPSGMREVAVSDLLTSPFTVALHPDEVLVELVVEQRAERSAYRKAASTPGGTSAVGAVGVAFDVEDGAIRRPRVAVGTLTAAPQRQPALERLLMTHVLDGPTAQLRWDAERTLSGSSTTPDPRTAGVIAELFVRTFDSLRGAAHVTGI